MTFTYDLPGGGDVAWVRFHIADTDANAPVFSDEEISALVAAYGGIGPAVVAALEHIIGLLSQPNFTADWLSVDAGSALDGYRALLAAKRGAFNLPAIVGEMRAAKRRDVSY
jgi:hypothetical protein